MAKRIITAFAEIGDRAAMPDTPSGDDSNYQTGYTAPYEADPVSDPSAKYPERNKMNQLFNDITGNIKEWQEITYPSFITSANNGGVAFPYRKGAIVSLGGVVYISDFSANTDTPPSAKWSKLNEGVTALTGGGDTVVNRKYLITDDSTYTLPSTTGLVNGDYVEFYRRGAAISTDPTPSIQVNGANSEGVDYYDQGTGSLDETDTSVQYNISAPLTFLFNATSGNWEL